MRQLRFSFALIAAIFTSGMAGADSAGRTDYRLLATSRTLTMEDELNDPAFHGFRAVGQAVLRPSTAGTRWS